MWMAYRGNMSMFDLPMIRDAGSTVASCDMSGIPEVLIRKSTIIEDFKRLLSVYAETAGSASAMDKACGEIAAAWPYPEAGVRYAANIRDKVQKLYATRTPRTREDFLAIHRALTGS